MRLNNNNLPSPVSSPLNGLGFLSSKTKKPFNGQKLQLVFLILLPRLFSLC